MPTFPVGDPLGTATRSLATVEELAVLLRRTFSAAETVAAALILTGASDSIRSYVHQTISVVEDDEFVADADGVFELWLPERPVRAVSSITVDGAAVATTSYSWRQSGRIRFPWGLGYTGEHGYVIGGDRTVTVVYSHGFDPIPGDIKGVCLNAAARAFYNPEGSIASADGSGGFTAGRNIALTTDEKRELVDYRPAITSVPITTGCW